MAGYIRQPEAISGETRFNAPSFQPTALARTTRWFSFLNQCKVGEGAIRPLLLRVEEFGADRSKRSVAPADGFYRLRGTASYFLVWHGLNRFYITDR